MPDPSIPALLPSRTGTTVWLIVLALLLSAVWFSILVVVPSQTRKFNEFGLQLPPITKFMIDMTMLLSDWKWLTVPGSFLFVGGIVLLTRHVVPLPLLGTVVAQGVTVLLIGFLSALILSLAIPLMKLAEGLAK